MALINCPECGTQISNKAESCPKCALPLRKRAITEVATRENREGCFLQTLNCGCMIGLVFIILIVVLIIFAGFNGE